MAVSEDIFHLVKSMNRAEKTFFRRYAKMAAAGKNLTYLNLFCDIEKQAAQKKSYDENLLRKKLGSKKSKHFPVLKNNLYNMILDSLSAYSEKSTPEEKIKLLLSQYDRLYSKALYKQCVTLMKKAIEISERNELLSYHYILLRKKRVLARYTEDVNEFNSTISAIYKEQNAVLDKMKNNTEVMNLSDICISLLQKNPTGFARTSEETTQMQRFMEHPLLNDESKILTRDALSNVLTFKTLFCQHIKDFAGALAHSKRRVKITWERFKNDRSLISAYIISIYSVLVYSIRTGNSEDYEEAYFKLKSLPAQFPKMSERNRVEVFFYSSVPELSFCNETLDANRGLRAVKEIEAEYEKLGNNIPPQQRIILFYFISTNCFVRGDYAEASKWLGRLINMPNVDLSQDYQCYGRVINLIVQYELGNIDSIEYALKSTYHFLAKREKVYKYEKIILDYMRKSFRIRSNNELMELFVFMKKDLLLIRDDPFEENAFDAFNFLPWLASKIENITYAEAAGINQ